MQIVTHVGAQCTDGERLLKSLMRNSDALYERRVAVPGHGRYRKLLRETILGLAGNAPARESRDVLLDAILGDREADRLVMSNPTFICMPPRVFEGGGIYMLASERMRALDMLFPQDDHEIFLALRNLATLIPALHAQAPNQNFAAFMHGTDPRDLRWGDLVDRIREAMPGARLVVWCNEDTPLLWNTLLHELAGVASEVEMAGTHDLLAQIMSPAGFTRFTGYLQSHPPANEQQSRRIVAAFLDKYALADEIEEEVDLPEGWDAAMVEDLTTAYETEVETLAARSDITFLQP